MRGLERTREDKRIKSYNRSEQERKREDKRGYEGAREDRRGQARTE